MRLDTTQHEEKNWRNLAIVQSEHSMKEKTQAEVSSTWVSSSNFDRNKIHSQNNQSNALNLIFSAKPFSNRSHNLENKKHLTAPMRDVRKNHAVSPDQD